MKPEYLSSRSTSDCPQVVEVIQTVVGTENLNHLEEVNKTLEILHAHLVAAVCEGKLPWTIIDETNKLIDLFIKYAYPVERAIS